MKRGQKLRALAHLLKGWRSGSGASRLGRRRLGRPPGSGAYRDAQHFEGAVMAAIGALRDRGVHPSQERVGKILHLHKDSVARLAREHELDWREMTSRGSSTRD